MSFPGISFSLAGAEPGRSGFPASITSLLDCPPAPRLGGLFWPLSGRASVKSVPLPGDDRARIEMSTRAPSAVAFKRGWAGFPVPAAPCNAERTGAIIPTRDEVCAKRGGCESAATTRYQAKGSVANLTGRETPPGAIRVGLAVDVSQSATSERMDVTAGRDRHPLSGGVWHRLEIVGDEARQPTSSTHLQSAAAWNADTQAPDHMPPRRSVHGTSPAEENGSSRSSARPALYLPTGGLIPVGFCLSHLPRRADLQPRAGGFCGALTNRRVSA